VPHIIIEHNATNDMDMPGLTEAMHVKAMTIEALPVGGLRVRSHRAETTFVGDGAAENRFIYITVRLGQGRSDAVKKEIGETLFAVMQDWTKSQFDQNLPLSLGLEIQEIEKDWTWKQNNIHQIIKDKR